MATTKRRFSKLAFVAPAILLTVIPGQASASSGDKKSHKGSPAPAKRVAPAAPQPVQPQPARLVALTAPSGTDRMVSDRVQLRGKDGSGAGQVRVDLEGARPDSAYEVLYVPEGGASRGQPWPLGSIRTDARGSYHGAAPEPLIPLEEAARSGTLVLRRLPAA